MAKRVAAAGPVYGPWALPDGWRWERLGDVCEPSQYGWTTKAASSGQTKFLRTTDISSGRVDWSTVPYCAEAPSDLDRYRVKVGDILISRAGSVGKSFLIDSADEAVFASYLIRFRPLSVPRYIYHWLQTDTYWSMITENTAGIAIPNVNASKLSDIPVPMAPTRLRAGIAARIEELFAEIDDGEAALARARDDLATWRKALLKSAVNGELTADWRAANPIAETGADLLANLILKKEASKRAKKSTKSDVEFRNGDLPAIPHEWAWSTVGQIAHVSGGITKNAKRDALPLRLPYLRVGNVYAGRVDLTRVETIGVSEGEAERSVVKDGDLLIVEGNGSIDQIGRSAIWNGQIDPCLHQNHLIKVRFSDRRIAEWMQVWLQSPWGRKELEAQASSTSGLHTLSISKVAGLRCPVPPLRELDASLSMVQRLTAEATAGGDDMNTMTSTAVALRRSILAAAFRGELA